MFEAGSGLVAPGFLVAGRVLPASVLVAPGSTQSSGLVAPCFSSVFAMPRCVVLCVLCVW